MQDMYVAMKGRVSVIGDRSGRARREDGEDFLTLYEIKTGVFPDMVKVEMMVCGE